MGIIGRPFESFIDKQVKIRQEALGEGFGSDLIKTQSREAFMTATPFIRLASSVTISTDSEIASDEAAKKSKSIKNRSKEIQKEKKFNGKTYQKPSSAEATATATAEYEAQESEIPGKSIAQQIKENGLFDGTPESEWIGSGLAQKCVLNGVPTSYTRDENGNYSRSSIAGAVNVSGTPFGGKPSQFNSAYGWGYNDTGILNGRGYIPPPGITSVDFEYKNDGALAQATINIKAFSPEQFAIIDILYMRPGFTVLLEFGHSSFLDKNGNITSIETDSTIPFDYLFDQLTSSGSSRPSYSQMAKQIRDEKKNKDGNYEGFFGRITKFNWKFGNDGTYNITIKLTGTGDVINSLNTSISKLSNTARSILTGKQSSTYKSEQGKPTNTQIFKGYYSGEDLEANYGAGDDYDIDEAEEAGDFIISDAFESQLNYELYTIFNDSVAFRGNGAINSSAAASPMVVYSVPILGKRYTKQFRYCVLKYDVNDAVGGTEYSPVTFLKFGALLSMIQKICNVSDGKDNMLIQFEMVRNIFCKEIKNDGNELYEDNTGDIFKEDETYMATFPGNISGDPGICLKSFKSSPTEITGEKYSSLTNELSTTGKIASVMNDGFYLKTDANNKLIDSTLAYRLSQVWININFVTQLLRDLRVKDEEEKQEVPLLDLIQGILTGVNESCGSINNFRVIFDEETSEVKILSESPALTSKKSLDNKEKYTTINTFGFDKSFDGKTNYGSFVTNLDLNSELSDKMATQITIGAASNNNSVSGNGAAFASYSKGLKDMLFVQKVATLQKLTNKTSKSQTELIDDIIDKAKFEKALKQVYNDNEFDDDAYISTVKQVNSQLAPKIMDQYFNKGIAPSPSFLPFNMSLTMHGLGGIRIYDAFKIDGKVLPLSYNPKDIKLIIKSLSHSISLDGWKTTISTLSVPDNENYKPAPTGVSTSSNGGGSRAAGGTRPSSNSKLQDCEVLIVNGFDTPSTYGGKSIRGPLTNSSIHMNRYVKRDILPLLESPAFKKKYTKGLRMIALVYAIKEGYTPKSKSYKTKNPGNIGNTDSGATNQIKTLKQGLEKLLDFLETRGSGKASGWKFGPVTIPQYFSNEIDRNRKNYQRPDGCLPGYTGNYQGQLGYFVKRYATFARVNNNGISGIKTIFKFNGYGPDIDGNTKLPDLFKFNNNSPIKTSKR